METYFAQQVSAGPDISGVSSRLKDSSLSMLEKKIKNHPVQVKPWLIWKEHNIGNKVDIIKYVDINANKWIDL